MPGPLDSVDQQIMTELRKNARISLVTLGERVLLSRNAVRQRIERMERDGFIQGYTIVDTNPQGSPVVSANLLVYRVDRMRGADVVVALRAIPEVVLCDVLSGEFDLFVRLEAQSVERVQTIWEQISNHPGVKDITTALTLSTQIRRIFKPGRDV